MSAADRLFDPDDLGPLTPRAPDQAARDRIHQALDETLFVEAGAGSGKTSTLVERVVALVVGASVPISGIAAITFTEKAAIELRDRLRSELEEVAGDAGRSRSAQAAADRALDELDGAPIGTLHAFCRRILGEHALEAELPPAIEVLDEIGSQLEFERRWSAFREQLLDDPAIERTLLLAVAAGVDFGHLEDLAVAFDDNWDLLATHVDFEAPDPPRLMARALCVELDAIVAEGERCLDPADKMLPRLDVLARWRDHLRSPEEAEVVAALVDPPSFKVSRTGRRDNWPSDCLAVLRERILALEPLCAAMIDPFADACLRRLAAEVAGFTLAAAEDRRRHGRLEFHDLLVLARELVREDRGGARHDLRARYPRLLLDEFQDTDPIQLELALRLAAADAPPERDWRELRPEPGRVFFVGDPKQSIYRFRRADIGVFLDARDAVVRAPVQLTANFRSTAPIVDWVNTVFGRLIQPQPGAQPAFVPLEPTRTPLAGPGVAVLGADGFQGKRLADEWRAVEATEVAATIGAALTEGWMVQGEDGPRRARPGDIAVLLPARTSLPALEGALERAGISARAESSSLVYSTPEIRALLLAAKAIDDPGDELAVVATLRSLLFGCSDVDLARWKLHRHGSWHPLGPLPEPEGDDPVHDAMVELAGLIRRRHWLTPSELLAELIERRRLLELGFASGRPRDLWRRARFVVDQARAWSEAGGTGLRAYLEWAAYQSADGARVAEVVLPETDDDSVRIMTVHAAKGLEFPIAIVSGLTTKPQKRRSGARVLWHEGTAEYQARKVTTERFDEAKAYDEQLDHHERLRLLYVACTRARDHLVVSLNRGQDLLGPDAGATSAELLAWGATDAPHVKLSAGAGAPGALAFPAALEPWPYEEEAVWRAALGDALGQASRRRTTSATRVAKAGLGEDDRTAPTGADDPGLAKDPLDLDLPPWRRGRYGTAVGRAVHGVLQVIDLATGEGLDAAAAAQAAAEGVLGREELVADLARSALQSAPVRAAVASGRWWRELYVATDVGGTLLEGYVDLVYETPDGLVVVDYKTDAVPDDDALDAAMARYARQGGAYVLGVEQVTERPVVRCSFVFCGRGAARVVDLEDPRRWAAEVASEVASLASAAPNRSRGA